MKKMADTYSYTKGTNLQGGLGEYNPRLLNIGGSEMLFNAFSWICFLKKNHFLEKVMECHEY